MFKTTVRLLVLAVLASAPAHAAQVKHRFVSTQPQSSNPDVVSTSQWNDDHATTQVARTITASYTVLSGDDLIICRNSSSATVTLPVPTGQGHPVVVRRASSGDVVVVVSGSGTIAVDASLVSSVTLSSAGARTFVDSTDGWVLLHGGATLDALGGVPTSRTVAGKALSSNVSLVASDVGADPSGSASAVASTLSTHAALTTTAHGGLLPAGTTTAGVPDSTGYRYVTEVQRSILGAAESTITWRANDFDPTVSGLAGSVGAVCSTYDQKKAWKRWGTDVSGLEWAPLHTTTGSLAASAASLNIPVYADTLGAFTVDIANLQSDTAASDHPHIVPLVNGSVVTATNTQKIAYNGADIYAMVDTNLVGGFGVWFDNVDAGMVHIECLQPQSSLGVRVIRFKGIHYKSAATNKVVVAEMDVVVTSGEITSVGVGMLSTSGNAMFPINTGTWRLERRP